MYRRRARERSDDDVQVDERAISGRERGKMGGASQPGKSGGRGETGLEIGPGVLRANGMWRDLARSEREHEPARLFGRGTAIRVWFYTPGCAKVSAFALTTMSDIDSMHRPSSIAFFGHKTSDKGQIIRWTISLIRLFAHHGIKAANLRDTFRQLVDNSYW